MGYSSWGHKELDTKDQLTTHGSLDQGDVSRKQDRMSFLPHICELKVRVKVYCAPEAEFSKLLIKIFYFCKLGAI